MPKKLLTPTPEQIEVLKVKNIMQAKAELNVSRSVIRRWKDALGLSQHPRTPGRPCRQLPQDLIDQLGKLPDTTLSLRYKIPLVTVRSHRTRREIPAYDPKAATAPAASSRTSTSSSPAACTAQVALNG